ncbi:MAG TPA: type II toxin-antitoxin system HicA family toxin [Methylomirabilota bacterium]|nr:type II toxin-antitoxin system HicA family toxin [Methylomirabilota bacterium]
MPYKAREALAQLRRAGFVIKAGSHVVVRHADRPQTCIAMHSGDVPSGALRRNQVGMMEEEFRKW